MVMLTGFGLDDVERDSVKDQAVVVIFIITTGGLLIYAAVRPWVNRWLVRSYKPPFWLVG